MSRGAARSDSPAHPFLRNSNWIALAAPIFIVAAQFAYGAMTPFSALALAFAGSLLAGLALADRRLRDELSRSRAPIWPGLAYIVVILVGLWSLTPWVPGGPHPVWSFTGQQPAAGTADKSLTALELIKLCGLACFFLVGAFAGRQDQRADLAIKATIACGAVLALWSFGTQVSGVHGAEIRLLGPYANANATATLMGILFLMSFALTVRSARAGGAIQATTRSLPLAAAALVFVVCLMMTASRAGALSAAAGLVVFALLYLFGRGEPLKRGSWAIVSTIFVLAAIVGAVGDRLFGRIEALSFGDRARETLFVAHWEAFKAAPWTGNGLGTFDIVNRTLLNTDNVVDLWSVRATHNVYLSWLELGGLLAATPMFVCIGAILFQTIRGAFRRSRMTTVLFALLGADVVVLTHGAADFALEIYGFAVIWSFLLGLQYALAQGSQ